MTKSNLMLEKERLDKAVDAFAAEMKEVLFEKAKEGKRGWDGKGRRAQDDSYIVRELWNDATDLDQSARARQYTNCLPTFIDIANRTMILWYRHSGIHKEDKMTGRGTPRR